MTNKIIEAARKAQIYANPWAENDATWPVDRHDLARFYAIARAEALEDAAKAAAIHSQYPIENDFDRGYSKGSRDASERILALKEQDAAIAAGKGEG